MGRTSKHIGNEYEREFAKKLSYWLTGSHEKLAVWRNVHSGSVGTIHSKKGYEESDMSGDFQAIDPEYHYFFTLFHIDSKSYGKWNPLFINSKNQKSNQLLNEWKEEFDKATAINKIPMLPVKIRDRTTPEFILFPNIVPLPISISSMSFSFCDELKKYSCLLVLQDEFFENVEPEEFFDLVKKITSVFNKSN